MKDHYKNFNIYINGLKRIIKFIESQDIYIFRIFIDNNIKSDNSIMNLLTRNKNIEIFVFKCEDYIKDNFHIDLLATLIRLFPIFDFKNNDSNNVIIIDIDLKKEDLKTLIEITKLKENKKKIIANGET